MALINPERVSEISFMCVPEVGTPKEDTFVLGGDFGGKTTFSKTQLEKYRDEITKMLMNLPDSFMLSKGRGDSFVNMCNDKNGELWTGMQPTMAQLVILGLAIGKVKLPLPKAAWVILPGGMPAIAVIDTDKELLEEKDEAV